LKMRFKGYMVGKKNGKKGAKREKGKIFIGGKS